MTLIPRKANDALSISSMTAFRTLKGHPSTEIRPDRLVQFGPRPVSAALGRAPYPAPSA